jgi:hypothetical protein
MACLVGILTETDLLRAFADLFGARTPVDGCGSADAP